MAQRAKTQSTSTATEATTTGAETVADAFIYGYPLVIMDATRKISTAVPSPAPTRAPVNQFAHLPAFPDASFTDVVSPNADTLYSAAWLDLSAEPVVLSVPDMGNRYYLMPMLDAWTNVFASPGTRTTGNSKKDFAIVGPGWSKPVPDGLTRDQSADEYRLDHRTHTDERKKRFRRGSRRSASVFTHTAQFVGQTVSRSCRRPRRQERRYKDMLRWSK